MSNSKNARKEELNRFANLIKKQAGVHAVRPYRADGFVNLLNKYGTQADTTEHYQYNAETVESDDVMTQFYEGNGLFARIIDAPADEAVKHGFELKGISNEDIENFYRTAMDELDWEEVFSRGIKWARLYGGALGVMLINDGRGLDEPLDWEHIESIDDIRIYDRSVITPDYQSMFKDKEEDPFRIRGSQLGEPEFYNVCSIYGNFRVHESRCLIFKNGTLPEKTTNSNYQMWGMPEYVRIKRAIRDTEVAHGSAVKLLDKSVQAVYKMKNLMQELATEEGEDRLLKRLQIIDTARGLMNSIAIDSDGEDYSFRTFSYTGVDAVINTTCQYLSALTNIPQTILFGKSPSGMNATGHSDLENWYNYIESIQKRVLKKNIRYLLAVIFKAGMHTGEISEIPNIKIEFLPLWSMSESEKLTIEQQKIAIQQSKANVAKTYVDMQALDPSEVRSKLADSSEFDVETMLDDCTEEELENNAPAEAPEEPNTDASDAGVNLYSLPKGRIRKELMPVFDGYISSTNFNSFVDLNMKHGTTDTKNALRGVFEEGGMDAVRKEYYNFKMNESTANLFEMSASDAVKIIKDAVLYADYKGWAVDRIHDSKAKIINRLVSDEEMRNAALNAMYWNYLKQNQASLIGFDEFLNTPITVYRLHGDGGDIFTSCTLSRDAAERNADVVSELLIRPIDTYGSVVVSDEAEVFVPAFITEGNNGEQWRETPKSVSHKGVDGIGVGVYIVEDGKILTGKRFNCTGYGKLCGPGGHIDAGETPEQAAIRETQEEFGVTPVDLIPFGRGSKENGHSYMYVCTEYEGTPHSTDLEMTDLRFRTIKDLIDHDEDLYPCFKEGIIKLADMLGFEARSSKDIAEEKGISDADDLNERLSILNKINEIKRKRIDDRLKSGIISIHGDESSWITTDKGHRIMLDEMGNPSSGNKQALFKMWRGKINYVDSLGKKGKVSPLGRNKMPKGITDKKVQDHFQRHGVDEMHLASADEYIKKGREFLTKPVGGNIVGYATSDGKVVRFDKETTEYASGYPNGWLCTYMLAQYDKGTNTIDKEEAAAYYYGRKADEKKRINVYG